MFLSFEFIGGNHEPNPHSHQNHGNHVYTHTLANGTLVNIKNIISYWENLKEFSFFFFFWEEGNLKEFFEKLKTPTRHHNAPQRDCLPSVGHKRKAPIIKYHPFWVVNMIQHLSPSLSHYFWIGLWL